MISGSNIKKISTNFNTNDEFWYKFLCPMLFSMASFMDDPLTAKYIYLFSFKDFESMTDEDKIIVQGNLNQSFFNL
jgi:hypothetical protein